MPQHQANSLGAVARRLQRSQRLARDLRRDGPWIGDQPARPEARPGERPEHGPGSPGWSTVDATIRPVGAGRYRRLGWAPGEDHRVRTDLGATSTPDRLASRRSLLYVAHHTDVHVCDSQSPARVEGGEAYGWVHPGSDAGHRPQETCTTQVFDQLVRATNAVATSPVSGAEMAWCIQTGDNTDNRTNAEVGWWLDVLAGRPVAPNTGAAGRYEGLQRSAWRAVWHPDRPGWDRRQQQGFPHLPGFLDAAVAPFATEGLQVPWLTVFGNHDQLFTGTFGDGGAWLRIDLIEPMLAASSVKPANAIGLIRAIAQTTLLGADTARWERWAHGPGVAHVTPDGDARRALPIEEYLARILAEGADGAGAGPVGHGFSATDAADRISWWSRPDGDHVQVIGLDTCNHTDGDSGCLGPRQTAWLEAELARHHTRYQDPDGGWRTGSGPDRLVVIASHHNSWTMRNQHDDAYDPGPRTLGPDLVALLDRFPNVVLWLNGHTHRHQIEPHVRPSGDGAVAPGGWWEVSTASGIDFGQQARTVELFDNGDGTASILVTVIDHLAPPLVPYRSDEGWTPTRLASISREVASNDDRWFDPIALLGERDDRNVELVVAAPILRR